MLPHTSREKLTYKLDDEVEPLEPPEPETKKHQIPTEVINSRNPVEFDKSKDSAGKLSGGG